MLKRKTLDDDDDDDFTTTLNEAQTPFSEPPDVKAPDFNFELFMRAWKANIEVQRSLVEAARDVNSGFSRIEGELRRSRWGTIIVGVLVIVDIAVHLLHLATP